MWALSVDTLGPSGLAQEKDRLDALPGLFGCSSIPGRYGFRADAPAAAVRRWQAAYKAKQEANLENWTKFDAPISALDGG